jgi:exodeoxyribonuclease VII large subunit
MRYVLLEARHRLREQGVHRALRQLEDFLRRSRQQTDEFVAELSDALRARLDRQRRRLAVLGHNLASVDLRARLRSVALRLGQRSASLNVRIERQLVGKRRRLDRLRLQIEERSPLGVLARGYAICYDAQGNVVREAAAVDLGGRIKVQLSRGTLGAEVKDRS